MTDDDRSDRGPTSRRRGVAEAPADVDGVAKGAAQGGGGPDLIAQNLRTLFDGVAQEELPDRFKTLLAKLAEKEGK